MTPDEEGLAEADIADAVNEIVNIGTGASNGEVEDEVYGMGKLSIFLTGTEPA